MSTIDPLETAKQLLTSTLLADYDLKIIREQD